MQDLNLGYFCLKSDGAVREHNAAKQLSIPLEKIICLRLPEPRKSSAGRQTAS